MTERRRDALTGEWRVVASHRQGRTFLPGPERCPLCPTREGGPPTEIPWPSFDVAVFDNRFPALMARPPPPSIAGSDLHQVAPALGATEVVVYSDVHTDTLATLGPERARLLVDVWAERYAVLGARAEVAYVFVFENRGEAVGVTLHHPHGQIYGFPSIPPVPARELAVAGAHLAATGRCLLCDVAGNEAAEQARTIRLDASFITFVPFAPRFPYEVHVVARRHVRSLVDLGGDERDALAEALVDLAGRYDRLFGFALPYVMAMHQSPTDGGDWDDSSHLHVEFTPRHRSADRLKYLAGSELGAGAYLLDVAPETAAAALRAGG